MSKDRSLTTGEVTLIQNYYGGVLGIPIIGYNGATSGLDLSDIRIHNHTRAPWGQSPNEIVTPDGELYAGSNAYQENYAGAQNSWRDKALLLHEVYHVIQNQLHGWTTAGFITASAVLNKKFDGNYYLSYDYSTIFAPGSSLTFNDLNFEARAAFLQDYYLVLNNQPLAHNFSGLAGKTLSDFQQFLPTSAAILQRAEAPATTEREFIILHQNIIDESHVVVSPLFAEAVKSKVDLAKTTPSPLVLDLDGDGVHLTSINSTGSVYWDHDHNGFAEASGWISKTDGFLAIDLNADGKINNGSELFGDQTGYTNGFLALAQYDSNSDGQITSADTNFSNLRVWVDANQNGYSESTELHTLSEENISAISLSYSNVNVDNAGNTIKQAGTFTMNGNTREVVDAYFSIDKMNTVSDVNYSYDTRVDLLPLLRGYGNMPALSIAMSLDNIGSDNLLDKVQTIANADADTLFSASFNLQGKVSALMLRWAGVDTVTPGSRGAFYDAQKLTFLEKFLGQPFVHLGTSSNPLGAAAAEVLAQAWDTAYNAIAARIIFQTAGHQVFSTAPVYNYATDSFTGSWALDSAYINSQTSGMSMADLRFEWANIFKMIDAIQGIDTLTAAQKSDLELAIVASDPSGQLNYEVMSRTFNVHDDAVHILSGSADTYNTYVGSTNVVLAGAGNDTMNGWEFSDVYSGGDGNDIINGITGNDYLFGGRGDDTLTGGAGIDVVSGGEGNDTVIGYDSGEKLSGGAGYDRLSVAGVTFTGADLTDFEELVSTGGTQVIDAALLPHFVALTSSAGDGGNIYLTTSEAGTYDLSAITVTGNLTINDYDIAASTSTIIGSQTAETINGNRGADIISGLGGNDTINGGEQNDTLSGGNGNDIIRGDAGNDTIYGDDGNDTLEGGDGDDVIYGGAGADVISGGYGLDAIYAGDGNDLILGSGISTNLAEIIDGGSGFDSVRLGVDDTTGLLVLSNVEEFLFSAASYKLRAALLSSVTNLTYEGTPGGTYNILGADAGTYDFSTKTITGKMVFTGSSGTDIITGTLGNDDLRGGYAGSDIIHGGGGNDLITASTYGTCTLYGDAGDDTLTGGLYVDAMYGGDGNDTIMATNMASGEIADGGAGYDKLVIGNNNLTGVTLSNIEELSITGAGAAFTMSGSQLAMFSTLVHAGGASSLFTINASAAGTFDISGKSVTGVVTISGNNGGVDTLIGGAGNDTLKGNGGDDILIGNAGNDILNGGTNIDTASYSASTSNVLLNMSTSSQTLNGVAIAAGTAADGLGGTDTLTAIEKIIGSAQADWFYGGSADETFIGGAGNDTITGAAGNDTVDYSTSTSGVLVNNSSTAHTLNGVSVGINQARDGFGGTDTLSGIEYVTGSNYADYIYNSTGANIVDAGGGNDWIFGAAGADQYIWRTGGGNDTVADFENGSDKFRLLGTGASYGSLTFADTAAGATISLGGNVIFTLTGINKTALDSTDFLFS